MTAVNAPPGGPRLRAEGIRKTFPGVRALQGVSISLAPGEVRALLGRNGAGKSTLVKILSGALRPDAGRIRLDGRDVQLPNPAAAQAHGIATVHQELSIVPELSVAENMLLGRWRSAGARGMFIRPAAMRAHAAQHLDSLGVAIDPAARAGTLSLADRQAVEIARALSHGTRVLILDEPTSSLAEAEARALHALIRRLAATGLCFLYISHRMDEIARVADSVTVLRDGREVATEPIAKAGTERVVELMTGDTADDAPAGPRRGKPAAGAPAVLSVRGLCVNDSVRDVSFELRAGEIIGVAGLLGSGSTELLRCLAGQVRRTGGSVTLDGRAFTPRGPRQAMRAGVGYAPADRAKEGLVLGMSVSGNLVAASLPSLRARGLLSRRQERLTACASRDRLSIKAPSLRTAVGTLSGGNQQKVILGRLLNAGSRVLLLDEPTRGVDVTAKRRMYRLFHELAAQGVSILVVSSELEELFAFCDRLLVLHGGRVVGHPPIEETTPASVMTLAMGGAPR
ncbi:sugar ABC transporter ATP-binding protein [Streptomyces litchfieldiae]|uniref:Sugar ABC transporter ATP-binding protein n=1 Tax=Streptomyces litchfieldiae TaxID=3075543 RepID=A0ABU2MK06_9ACTN|nr:sugar ABC transporter ATP-binding protein [Streptomyces sp. DSM 44938]MDT0341945.1 sugar ABC transporter ATP-binding protein [Streptomyces sp. DSM 44938]